jgi:hypothetical protein
MTPTKPTDPLTSSGPETKKVTALKLELKQLREQLKESCGRLPEKEQHLFAADCAERGYFVFKILCSEDQRLPDIIELRRQWANGQASGEDWRAAQNLAHQIAQEVLPTHEDKPTTQDLKTGASYAAQAAVASPYDAALYAASALFLFYRVLSRYGEEIRWQWKRVQQYLQGKVTEENDRQEEKQALKRILARINYNMARDEQMTKEEQEKMN